MTNPAPRSTEIVTARMSQAAIDAGLRQRLQLHGLGLGAYRDRRLRSGRNGPLRVAVRYADAVLGPTRRKPAHLEAACIDSWQFGRSVRG
jgi:hypothetical protein